jgi:large subunit ribosomal protein L10
MPLTRVQKEKIVSDLQKKLSKADSLIFSDFTGLSVAKTREFRQKIKKLGATFKVAKKTLIRRALKNSAADAVVGPESKTPVSVIFGGDIAELAKAVNNFSKTEALKVLGGFLSGQYLAAADIAALAKLPSRHDLLAGLARTIQAPVRNLASVLQANLRNLVCVLDGIKSKK